MANTEMTVSRMLSAVRRAEKQSGLTQNHMLEIARIAQICNKKKNMHTLPVYALNFEILKFSAAPETHLRVFSCLGGQIQHLWVRPLCF